MKQNVLSDDFFEELASQLNISETAFNSAERSYKAIGKIFKDYFKDFKIHVYPQGSTRLGTAIKPINENDEVILSSSEHASNILPWLILSAKKNIKVVFVDSKDEKLDINDLKKKIIY